MTPDPEQAAVLDLATAERDLGGRLGVAAQRLTGGDAVAYHDDEAYPAASTIKVFVLQALLERAQAGAIDLDEERTLESTDQVTGSGVLKSLSAGRAYTLRDLATLMIIVSDNTATNLVIERLGVDEVNAATRRHGWTRTRLAGLLQRPTSDDQPRTSSSTTSPRDLADAFGRLWRGELLDPQHTELGRSIYRRQQLTDQLGRYLPYDAYSSETGEARMTIASKSGSIRGVRNDAGVIETGDGAYVLAIMTRDCPDERFHPDNRGSLVVSRVSRELHRRFVS